MKPYRWVIVLLVCVLALSGCTKESAPTGPEVSPETSDSLLQPSPSGALPESEMPGGTPDPAITPVPSPDTVKTWANNEGVSLSVTSWSQSYSAEGSVCLSAEVNVPAFSGLPNVVTEYYGQILESFQRRSEAGYAEAKEWQKDGSLTRACELRQDFYLECNSGGFVSVRRLESYDSGGLRPEITLMCDNFRVSDGKLLSLDDFFKVPRAEYFPVLLEKTIAVLEARSDDLAEGWREDAEALFPFEMFCMTQGGLSLFYPEPGIAPYAIGTVRVDILWESIEDIWKLP